MDYWPILVEAAAAVVLLGLLWNRGLAGLDSAFTYYIGAIAFVDAALWITAQAGVTERTYGWTYIGLNAMLLGFIGSIVWRELPFAGWMFITLAAILAAGFAGGLNNGRHLYYLLHGQFGIALLIYAFAVFLASLAARSDFDHAKLTGLMLYWLAQGATWICVWRSVGVPGTVKMISDYSGVLGAMVCVWMIFSFSGMGLEGQRSPVEEEHDAPPAMEAVYRRRLP